MSADGIQQQQDIYPYTHQSPVQVFRTTVKDIWRLLIHQNPICHRFTGCTINGNAQTKLARYEHKLGCRYV